MFSHVDEFNDLPQPARVKAVEFYEELLQGGKDNAEALKQAHALAEEWLRERAPDQVRRAAGRSARED